jgi:tetratricopeptide (TPR) repeat protein
MEMVGELGDEAVAPLSEVVKQGGDAANYAVEALGWTGSQLAVAPLEAIAQDQSLYDFRTFNIVDRAKTSLTHLNISLRASQAEAEPKSVAETRAEEVSGPPLPAIGEEHLPTEFVAYEDEAGPGGDLQQEGTREWNGGNKDAAAALYEEALEKGLTPTHAAAALRSIGDARLDRGELEGGVDHLLRCLSTRPISSGMAHDAAVRLEIIYAAAGRTEESAAVARVAAATATPGIVLDHSYAERLRDLARRTGAS